MTQTVSISTQTPDFESEVVTLTQAEALDHFSSWPWREHLRRQHEIEAAGGEACPPNMSFSVGDRVVIAMMVEPGVFDLHVSSSRSTRRFGVFTKKEDLDWDVSGADSDLVTEFVKMLFNGNDEAWISFADSHASSSY